MLNRKISGCTQYCATLYSVLYFQYHGAIKEKTLVLKI